MRKPKKSSRTRKKNSKSLQNKNKNKPIKTKSNPKRKQNRKTKTKKQIANGEKLKSTLINKQFLNFKTMEKKYVVGIFAGVLLIVFGILSSRMWETVNSNEIVVIQDPLDGELHVYVGGTATGGLVYQNFGTATHYLKSFPFWFSKANDQGAPSDQSIKVRFNDGGHAQVSGSVRINLPTDDKSVIRLHTAFGSQNSIEQQLIRPMVEKVVYMTGPLMSSKESYAEKRTQLLNDIEDQASNGVYKTVTIEKKRKDELSGQEQTFSEVDIIQVNGVVSRQEVSPLKQYGVVLNPGTLSLNAIDYDPTVEAQIKLQQSATMQIITSMANARRAEQEAITTTKQGEANAAKAKWEQEVIKSQKITEAQQALEVQELATKQAVLYKQQQILEGEGEAEKKKLIMSADGALDKKLETIENMTKAWADAYSKRNVPQWYQVGGGGSNGNPDNEFHTFMNMANIANAEKIGLDLSVPRGATTKGK